MIIEIHGIESEKMDAIEQILLSHYALKKVLSFQRKIRVSASSGQACLENAHRCVFKDLYGTFIFLREPGKLCLTIHGSWGRIFRILEILGACGYPIPIGGLIDFYYKK